MKSVNIGSHFSNPYFITAFINTTQIFSRMLLTRFLYQGIPQGAKRGFSPQHFIMYIMNVRKGMVEKKSKGLFWRVFALTIPKVGPMALGISVGLGGI